MALTRGFFRLPDPCRTLALVVEGRTFWVPKDTLAMYSPVFKSGLYGRREERESGSTIYISNKKAKDIEELLLCLIPTPTVKAIDFSNMDMMMKLALEYKIEDLRIRVESFMTSELEKWKWGDPSVLSILRTACKHRIKHILEPCIKRCASEFDIGDLEAIADLPKAIISCLFLHHQMNSLSKPWMRINLPGRTCNICRAHGGPIFLHCTRCFHHLCKTFARKAHACTGKEKAEADIKRMQDTVKVLLDSMCK